MKVSPLVLALGAALLGALAWGTCQAGRASDATIRLAAALAAHDTATTHWGATRDSLTMALRGLQQDSLTLARRYALATTQAQRGRDSIHALLARLAPSDRVRAESAFVAVSEVGSACQAVLSNCEQRARNAEQRVQGDSATLATTEALLTTVRLRWVQAERRAQPSFFRDLWRARSVTLPLTALSVLLLVSHR